MKFFRYHWRRAKRPLVVMLTIAMLVAGVLGPAPFPTLPALAATSGVPEPPPVDPNETRHPSWSQLPEVLVLQPGQAGYPTAGNPDGAEPNIIHAGSPETTFRFALPSAWTPDQYKEVAVTIDAAPAASPARKAALQTATTPVTEQPAIPWQGAGYKDGLYLWSYTATPTAVACQPPGGETGTGTGTPTDPTTQCPPPPDLSPAQGGPFPLIIDRQEPEVLGLRTFNDGYLGVEVRDNASGVKQVKAYVYEAGKSGDKHAVASVDLTEMPLGALVQLNVSHLGLLDRVLELEVTDRAGNVASETLPLAPVLRAPQLGAGAPWLRAPMTIGGLPQAVNLASGNGFFTQTDLSIPVYSLALDITRSYNHQNRQKGLLGWGWRFSLDTSLRLWPENRATWYDASGTEYIYELLGSQETGPYVDGIRHTWPRLKPTDTGFILRWQSGESARFDKDGRILAVLDYGGVERLTYGWKDGQLHEVRTPVEGLRAELEIQEGLLRHIYVHRPGEAGGPASVTHTIAYDYTDGNLTRVTGLYGRTVAYSYDGLHRLTRISMPVAPEVTSVIDWAYGQGNRVTLVSSARNDVDPDQADKPAREFRELQYFPDASPAYVSVKDPLGETALSMDRLGRPSATARTVGGKVMEEQFRWQRHNLTYYRDPLMRVTTVAYDGQDNPTLARSPGGLHRTRWSYVYDAADRYAVRKVTTQQVKAETAATPDDGGQVVSTTTVFLENGRPTATAGPLDPIYSTTTYVHTNGLLTEVRDPRGYVTRYAYNSQGLVSRVSDWPGVASTGARTDESNEWTAYTHDSLGRVTSETTKLTAADQVKVEYAYDPTTGDVTVTQHQPKGAEVLQAPVIQTQVAFLKTYLPGSFPAAMTRRVAGVPRPGEPKELAVTYRYNSAGAVTEVAQGEEKVIYRYDAAGNLRSRTQREAAERFEYDAAGRLVRQIGVRGGYVAYEYDLAGQVTSQKSFLVDGGTEQVQESASYSYDPLGRVTQAVSSVAGTARWTYKETPDYYGITTTATQRAPEAGSTSETVTESESRYFWNGQLRMERTGADYLFYHPAFTGSEASVHLRRPASGTAPVDPKEADLTLDQVFSYKLDGRGRVLTTVKGAQADTTGSNLTTFTYDGLDRPVRVVQPAGEDGTKKVTTDLVYDADGQVVSQSDNDYQRQFQFTVAGDLLRAQEQWTDPRGTRQTQSLQMGYRPDFRLGSVRFVNGSGQAEGEQTYDYNLALNKILETISSGGTRAVREYQFDGSTFLTRLSQGGTAWGLRWNSLGRVQAYTTPGGRTIPLSWQTPAPAPAPQTSAAPQPDASTAVTAVGPAGHGRYVRRQRFLQRRLVRQGAERLRHDPHRGG